MTTDALPPDAIDILSAEVVGSNVAMTYRIHTADSKDTAEAGLDALLRSKLGLYALTFLNSERRDTDDGSEAYAHHFSVMASPLDRLFHKIGPSTTLTFIKHHAEALNMSVAQLQRTVTKLVGDGLIALECTLKPWDAGKFLGYVQQHVDEELRKQVEIFGEFRLEPAPRNPLLDLEHFPDLVARADGHVTCTLPAELIDALPS